MKRLLYLIPFLLTGCVATQNIAVEERSRIYDLDYDLVFDATVQVLAEEGFAIIDAQREEGIINTDYRAEDRILFFFSGPTRRKVSALISTAPNGTQVLLNFDLQEYAEQTNSGVFRSLQVPTRVAQRYYREFFEALEEYIQRY